MMTRRPFLSRVSENVMSRDAAPASLAVRGGVAATATTTSAAIATTAPNRCVNCDAMWTPETGVALKLLPSTGQAYRLDRMRRHLIACTIAPSLATWAAEGHDHERREGDHGRNARAWEFGARGDPGESDLVRIVHRGPLLQRIGFRMRAALFSQDPASGPQRRPRLSRGRPPVGSVGEPLDEI